MKAIIKKTGKIVTIVSNSADQSETNAQTFHILEDTEVKYRACELDFITDLWDFLSEWLPDYSYNEDVALSDDIQCCLDAEADADKLQRVINSCGPRPEDWEREQIRIDRELLEEACNNYYRRVYGRDRSE